MEPKMSTEKQTPKTTEKAELISLCSCNGCDTIRCYLSRKPTDDEDKFSKTCIYFTNVTIRKSSSNADTSTSDITSSDTSNKRSPPCETCRKENEMKKNTNTNKYDSLLKNSTTDSVCKICKRDIHDIDYSVDQKCIPAQIGNVTNFTAKESNHEKNMGKSNFVLKSINKNKPEYYKDVTNERNPVCNFGDKNNNVMNTPSDIVKRLKSECEICRQNIIKKQKTDAAKVLSNKSSVLDTINARNSVCEVCLRNLNKLTNDVSNLNKGLVSEVFRFNNNINAEPKYTLAENKSTNKPKCLSETQPKCNFCAMKYGTIPNEKLVDKKTPCKQNIQTNGDTNGMDNKITGKICTKQSTCKLCRRDNRLIRQIEKTEAAKSPQSYIVHNECFPANEKHYIKSKCKQCSKDIETYGKVDAFNNDFTKVIAAVKPKCSKCGRNDETYCKIGGVNSILTPTKIKSKCSTCGKGFERYSKTDDLEKKCKRYHKTNNDAGAKYSKGKEIKNECNSRLLKEQRLPIHSEKSLILCTCKNHKNFNQASLARESRVINVHNATVNYTRKDINPGAAKLSAQIMDVPYEEFQESFNYENQDDVIAKTNMRNNLSDEIIKRIKDVYRACSCKICECIAGKSLKLDNVCNCKPCDCDDCKSYKSVDLFAELRDDSKLSYANTNFPAEVCFGVIRKKQDQCCDCSPCDCIKCTQRKTFITARVSENLQANNCSCAQCRCMECERNFFSLSTHLTREMSTAMVRNCGCDQCLDQRCRGAGGTDNCRCEMPSKAISKPVAKDSHDYDIRRASVYHLRNKNNFDTIAMYASVSSNFPPLGTLKEACSCEDCECIACNNEDGKLSIETILKPQPHSHTHSVKTKNCVCKSCECEVCSYEKSKPECIIKYQDAECVCDECDCINCQTMASSSTRIKGDSLAKPIGKIYYKNSLTCGSQQCDDDLATNGSSRNYGNKQGHHVCMNATLDKVCLMENSDYDPAYVNSYINSNNKPIVQCHDKEPETFLYTKTFCNFQDMEDKQLPSRDTFMCNKNSHNDFSTKNENLNKAFHYFNYTGKDDIDQRHGKFQSDVEKASNKYKNKYVKDSEYLDFSLFSTNDIKGHCEIETSPYQLSNYMPTNSKTTLESCLKDILTLNEDLNINHFKIANNANKSNTIYKTHIQEYESDDINSYGCGIGPFSSSHRQSAGMSSVNDVYNKDNTQDFIWDTPLVLNSKQLNLSNNQIDYERVHKTLEEAKDFSSQLIKVLEKYERANKDFQSVSEKLKLSHGLNILSKLGSLQFEYVIIEKPNDEHDHYVFRDTVKDEKNRKSNMEKKSCTHHVSINNLKDFSDRMSTQKESLFNTNTEKNESFIQRKNPKDSNIEMSNQGDKAQIDPENIKKIEAKEYSELNQEPIKSCSMTVKDNRIEEQKLDVNIILTVQNSTNRENMISKFEDKGNTDQLKKLKGIPSTDHALNNTMEPTLTNNTQSRIDTLTDQLSEMIKENVLKNYEQILLSRNAKKYDFDVHKSQDDEINKFKDWSINKKNYYLSNNQNIKDSFTSPLPKFEMQSMSVQTSIERHIDNKAMVEKVIKVKSAASVPRNKTIQVEKECDTYFGAMMDKHHRKKNDQRKSSKNTLKSGTELDIKQQPQYNVAHSSQLCESTRSKCSCEDLKVCGFSGRRVSDHTVMVKWGKPKEMTGVQGYELLVDGRPVQKIIDSARCMAVVTCLPNCEKVLLTMRTVLEVPLSSGHKPTVTIIYRPRLKKIKTEETY